jgi:hypothetical protein
MENMEGKTLEELEREEDEFKKIIDACLWKAGYQGYEIHANYGLMFIFNKNKTNRKKLEWLKKYKVWIPSYKLTISG